MPETDIFEDNTPPSLDQDKDYFAELVGEDAKFKTPQDLARGKVESDLFIDQLKRETAELRDELNTRIKYEDFLDKLEQARRDDGNQSDTEQTSQQSAMKPEELEQLLERKLRERDARTTATQNLNQVQSKLREALGPNYAQRVKEQAQTLGVTTEFLNELAAAQPRAFYRMLGLDVERSTTHSVSPPKSSVNADALNFGNKTKGKSYYDEIRKKDSNLYFSPKIQNEIFASIKDIGEEKFYSS
jgi:hypothetical protein